MNIALEFGLNMIMAVLLGTTIFYCWLLNKRIQVLQDSKSELAKLLKHFDRSTVKATESIAALQDASKKLGDTIHARIEKANYALDDLSYMIDRANKVADQMEAGLAIARQKDKLSHDKYPTKPGVEVAVADVKKQMMVTPEPDQASNPVPATPKTLQDAIHLATLSLGEDLTEQKNGQKPLKHKSGTTLSSLQALIEKVAERKSDPVLRGNQKISPGLQSTKARSKSEEELLEALRYSSKV